MTLWTPQSQESCIQLSSLDSQDILRDIQHHSRNFEVRKQIESGNISKEEKKTYKILNNFLTRR
ncbi:12060_t:CDS:1, partial [Gigaspora rosea]